MDLEMDCSYLSSIYGLLSLVFRAGNFSYRAHNFDLPIPKDLKLLERATRMTAATGNS